MQVIDWVLSGLGIGLESRFGQFLSFFIYDSLKIILLLLVMITLIGFLRTYLPQQRVKKWLSGRNKLAASLGASVFGAITPFCSCSSIPIFLGFLSTGIPLGVSFSFLITSPLINEYMVVLMLGVFGWKITLAYVASGILIGVVSGLILGRMNLQKYLVRDIITKQSSNKGPGYRSVSQRVIFGVKEAMSIVKKLWFWILVGVGVGALIHNFVPQVFIEHAIGKGGIFTVPIATILGVPIYGSCAAVLPIAVALFQKGVPIGTALAFIMAIAALSLPEAIILRRALQLRLIAIFFGIVALAIMATGYLLNALQPLLT
jgi:hypothetical protein